MAFIAEGMAFDCVGAEAGEGPSLRADADGVAVGKGIPKARRRTSDERMRTPGKASIKMDRKMPGMEGRVARVGAIGNELKGAGQPG